MGELIGPIIGSGGGGGGGTGTVTNATVTSTNGLAGTVTGGGTASLAFTLSTTINSPILAGNGTAISGATVTGTGTTAVLSIGPAFTGVPTAPTATAGTNTTQIATTAFVAAIPVPSAFTLVTITADPAPGVVGTVYRANYPASGNFTLPTSPTTGSWITVKQIASNTLTIIGTVDGGTGYTLTHLQSVTFIFNANTTTSWDAT